MDFVILDAVKENENYLQVAIDCKDDVVFITKDFRIKVDLLVLFKDFPTSAQKSLEAPIQELRDLMKKVEDPIYITRISIG